MIDLTGGHLATFILSELRPVISRHPRFRDNNGSSLIQFSNLMAYNDISLVVGSINGDGNALSPDHFMCTLLGRACAAKLDGYNGSFVEWLRETDTEDTMIPAGVYYLGVEAVNEETREIRVVVQPYRWLEDRISNATGSRFMLAEQIPGSVVTPVDPAIDYINENHSICILTYSDAIALRRTDTGAVLVPDVDYWVELPERHLLLTTTGGRQDGIALPANATDICLMEDEYELRQGSDWDWDGEGHVKLAPWTQAGINIYVEGTFRYAPQGINYVHPENFLEATLGDGEELVPGQCTYTLTRGFFEDDLTWAPDGRACFRHLMGVGDNASWEIRIKRPQVYGTLYKMAVNPNFLPGLTVAVGDMVEVGDQIALVVFPQRCETYEVFGGKEGVTFEIAIKSNDLLTTTELGQLVKGYLNVNGRDRLEAAGLSITRISSSYQGSTKDNSGTTASHTLTLSVTAQGDWEIHKPLVNRVDDIDLAFGPDLVTYPGSPRLLASTKAFGISRFTPSYQ